MHVEVNIFFSGCAHVFTSTDTKYRGGVTSENSFKYEPEAFPRATKPFDLSDSLDNYGFRFKEDVVGAYLKVKAPGTVIGCNLFYANIDRPPRYMQLKSKSKHFVAITYKDNVSGLQHSQ